MPPADELTLVSSRHAIWHAYDRSVKAELFSTVVASETGLTFVDPIPLAPAAQAELITLGQPLRIVLTSANHLRASAEFAEQYAMPVFAAAQLKLPGSIAVHDRARVGQLELVALPGGADGELAVYDPRESGAVIVGDALINFDRLTVLPAKYCGNQEQLVRSLGLLLTLKFDVLFFAHGDPLLSRARERLETLLAGWH